MLRAKTKQCNLPQRPLGQATSGYTYSPIEDATKSRSEHGNNERYNSGNISDVEKNHIYDGWIHAGKPHNLICSRCRAPGNLMPCETCCRSYHVSCLPAHEVSGSIKPFHCPSCRSKRWDQSPPQFGRSAPSSNASRCSTPGLNSYSRVASPSEHGHHDAHRILSALGPSKMAAQPPSVYSSPGVDRQQSLPYPGNIATPEADMLSRARNFLVDFGQFPVDQDFRPELIQRISSMMTELDAQQSLQQEIQKQQAENAALRKENANFRAYFAPRLPMSEPIINASTSNTPSILQGPSSDTSGKSWDRIVMDLI